MKNDITWEGQRNEGISHLHFALYHLRFEIIINISNRIYLKIFKLILI